MRKVGSVLVAGVWLSSGLAGAGRQSQPPAQPPPADTQALQRMAATERAFAAATLEIGVRDAFLTFFAPDSLQIQPGAAGSPARLRDARPALAAGAKPRLPLAAELIWNPYTGMVSGDGTFGWLTGPFVSRDRASGNLTLRGAYFSVWKLQPDGTWRVWLDEGCDLPDVWRDASEFRAAPAPDAGTRGRPGETIEEAEADAAGGGAGWLDRHAAEVRVHRQGRMPILGRQAVAQWAAAWTSVAFHLSRAETAASNDLAVTIGGYDARTADGAERGTWVRVWARDVTNRWRIVFETSKLAR
jgi:hypothetical protein